MAKTVVSGALQTSLTCAVQQNVPLFFVEYTEAVMKLHKCFKRAFHKHVPKEINSDDEDFIASKSDKGKGKEGKTPGKRGSQAKGRDAYNLDAIVSVLADPTFVFMRRIWLTIFVFSSR